MLVEFGPIHLRSLVLNILGGAIFSCLLSALGNSLRSDCRSNFCRSSSASFSLRYLSSCWLRNREMFSLWRSVSQCKYGIFGTGQ